MIKNLQLVILLLLLLLGTYSNHVSAQRQLGMRATDSGGPLMPEQAAYNVRSYDVNLRINPKDQSIRGFATVHALIVHPIDWFVLDLDNPLNVDAVSLVNPQGEVQQTLTYKRSEGKLWIALPLTKQPGEDVRVRVSYGGKPRVAPRPPWVGGFVWSKTASGHPWITLACQMDGADIWFPVKDHPSDEPETVSLSITVPEPLVVASNGVLRSVVKNNAGTQTFNWFVSTPINNYNITLNIAPYRSIEDKYTSVTGEIVPIAFWVLPEDFEKGAGLVRQTKDFLAFFEEYLGPYPFRSEKLGIAQTQYLGMEHQTIIAYGNNFKNNEHGFDWLMLHELGHEWWGNMVTASDWRDFWLHEGFQSFMDTLYVERLRGRKAYLEAMTGRMKTLRNMQPVAPRESRTTVQMYMAAPEYLHSDGDIYGKGAVILHTLRYLIGDKPFFAALKRMSYLDSELEKLTHNRHVRFATTDDFQHIVETASGQKLDWFFEVYLRQPKLPRLLTERVGNQMTLRWEVPVGLPFPMPIEVRVGNSTKRYELPLGKVTIPIEPGQKIDIDPENWILKVQ